MNVDRIARYYCWLEYLVFGLALQRRRLQFIRELSSASATLIVGDGDGRFLARFLEQNCRATVHYVDRSREMLRLAKKRGLPASRIRFEEADIRCCALPVAHYDLVATHFFLDCFDDEECFAVVRTIASAAAPKARWVISEFRIPDAGFSKWWATFWVRICYVFFWLATGLRTNTLPNYSRALTANGFLRVDQRISKSGMLTSELWERV